MGCDRRREPDESAAARAAERLARNPCRQRRVASFPPGSFDVICAWQVVEHLHDPVSSLRRCFEWLVPGGGWRLPCLTPASPVSAFSDAYRSMCPDTCITLAQTPRHVRVLWIFEIRPRPPRTIYTTLEHHNVLRIAASWLAGMADDRELAARPAS